MCYFMVFAAMWPTLIIWLFLFETISCQSVLRIRPVHKEAITVKHAVVATDDGRCSRIGNRILQKGGHAVDAAVAAAFCLGVVSPASSGIGGGAFMLVRSANGQVRGYNMRETAPSKASRDMFVHDPSAKEQGGLSVGVPGEILGLYEAWKAYGRLPWYRLVKPAIAIARYGYEIDRFLYFQMKNTEEAIRKDEGLREVFMVNGTLLKVGDICRDIKLANTLEKIAFFGASVFYYGPLGADLIHDIQEKGGIITVEDLKGYKIRHTKPISAKVMNHEIITMPVPAGGVGMIMVLNVLAQYRSAQALTGPLGLHRMVEAMKHMFSARMNLGDPDFVEIEDVVSKMLSQSFAREIKDRINDSTTFDPSYYLDRGNQTNDHGTSHVSIVDKERNAVALTTTINNNFGALFRSVKTGIVLNNQMHDFSIPSNDSTMPSPPANYIEPNKRPMSSTMPTIILENGQLKGVMGASGGLRIVPANIQVYLNHFIHRMDPFESILAPRLYHALVPNILEFEKWDTVSGYHIEVPLEDRAALAKKGHVLQALAFGAKCQFVVHHLPRWPQGETVVKAKLTGVSDPRKEGEPAGY
ncbi:hypothetical protein AMTRI_Chr05g57600 [Amborella trichopoda]